MMHIPIPTDPKKRRKTYRAIFQHLLEITKTWGKTPMMTDEELMADEEIQKGIDQILERSLKKK